MRRLIPVTLLAAMLCILSAMSGARTAVPVQTGAPADSLAGRRQHRRARDARLQANCPRSGASRWWSKIRPARARSSARNGSRSLARWPHADDDHRHNHRAQPVPLQALRTTRTRASRRLPWSRRAASSSSRNPSFPANNLRELIELCPHAIPARSPKLPTDWARSPNCFSRSLAKREGVQFLNVPYKGIGRLRHRDGCGRGTGNRIEPGSLRRAGQGRQGQGDRHRRQPADRAFSPMCRRLQNPATRMLRPSSGSASSRRLG